MAEKRIVIICGEPSGDLHAAGVAEEILKINSNIKISGVGGALLRDAGAEIFYDIRGLSVIGLFDALKNLPKFFALQKLILKKIGEERPDAIILVDFSGFNLRLAKKINPSTALRINKSIPVIYYISPQVWASRQGRVKTIKKYISKMLVFFKFEQEFYKKFGLDVDFMGHPLLDIVKPGMDKEGFFARFSLSADKKIITLLPGSRRQELENILPIMLKASLLISAKIKDAQFIIAKSPQLDLALYNRITKASYINLKIIDGLAYDCLNVSDFCLVASGTATLETAIMQKPFVVIYKLGLLNYLLYRPQVKTPYIGMVNIVAGRKIVPEFIQFQAIPEKIAEEVLRIFDNPSERERMKYGLAQVKASLGESGAASRAAKII